MGRIYDDLNRPPGWRGGIFTPKEKGYPASERRAEYVAEAIRAYLADPNYFKSVAANSAPVLRKAWNNNPLLREAVQLNAGGGELLLGGGLTGYDPGGR